MKNYIIPIENSYKKRASIYTQKNIEKAISLFINYINFLTENEELMGGVKVRCVTFDKSNLYFAYYGD